MTTVPGAENSGRAESFRQAETDLEAIRLQLQGVAGGRFGVGGLQEQLTGYVRKHEAALKAAAAEMTEEARRQLLEQLYAWRAQIRTQGEVRRRAEAPTLTTSSAKKSLAKKAATKTSSAKKAATKTPPAKKAATKTSPTNKAATKTPPAKKAATKKTTTNKAPTKAAGKKAVAIKASGKRIPKR